MHNIQLTGTYIFLILDTIFLWLQFKIELNMYVLCVHTVETIKHLLYIMHCAEHKDFKDKNNWFFWTVMLEKTPESHLDCKEIQPVHPKGDQSWVFIGGTDSEAETPILWPPNVESWLI